MIASEEGGREEWNRAKNTISGLYEMLYFKKNLKQELSDWITSEYSCIISKGHALSEKETDFLEVVKR